MSSPITRTLRRSVLALAVSCATAAQATPYLPTGPQFDVLASTVYRGGWTPCYAAPMSEPIGFAAEAVLSACSGDYLMMAGRVTGSDHFLILAQTQYAEAIRDTGAGTSNTHQSNGSEWYFSPKWSWGFTTAGNAVNLNECDFSEGADRMCLHTTALTGGYRIGSTVDLNLSGEFEKVFFVANVSTVPEQNSSLLLALGLLLLCGNFQQRKFR